MTRCFTIIALFVLSITGCQDAAEMQRAEDARARATAESLRQLGNDLHNAQNATPETSMSDASMSDASMSDTGSSDAGSSDSEATPAESP